MNQGQDQAMTAIECLQTAIEDLQRGDRIDALDSIRIAVNRIRTTLPNTDGDKLKWLVEFEVARQWVADGFELTDERALDMLATALPFATIESELYAKVVTAPSPITIRNLQGYSRPRRKKEEQS